MYPEVEIAYGHLSISVHFIGMTDHKYTWPVSVTACVMFYAYTLCTCTSAFDF